MTPKRPNHDEQVMLEAMRSFYNTKDGMLADIKAYYDNQGESQLYEDFLQRFEAAAAHEANILSHTQERERYDIMPDKWIRRETASLKYLHEAQKKLRSVYDQARIARSWGYTAGLQLMGGYDHRDEVGHHLLMGAAIWIMDSLYHDDRLHELLEIMPDDIIPMPLCDTAEKPSYVMPLVNHPDYRLEDILKLTYLLTNRNAELVRPAMVHRSLTDEWTTSFQRTSTEGCPQRKLFEQIMDMLDKKAVQLAAQRFEQKVWEFYRLVFKADQMVEDEFQKRLRRANKLEARLQMENQRQHFPTGPVASLPNVRTFGQTTAMQSQLQQELRQARYAADEYQLKIGSFFTDMTLPNDREKRLVKFKDLFPADLYDQLWHFGVDDPYETCFAVLYLLDAGSDIPWLHYGALGVTYAALDQLPFAANLQPPAEEPNALNNAEIRNMYRHQYPCQGKHKGEKDGDGDPVNREVGLNLAQLLYEYTGVVWPRYHANLPVPEKLVKALEQLNQKGEDVYQLLLLPYRCAQMKEFEPVLFGYFNPDENDPSEITESEDQKAQQRLSEMCRRQQGEIKNLRAQTHKCKRDLEKLKDNYEQLTEEAERMRQELAELRESVYHFQNEKQLQEIFTDEAISFPFHTKQKLISFGGHPSWLNSIRTLLPDVRFIAPDRLPDEKLIRNADAVWLQPNCMSHADFFRIINIVRNENKSLHYFGYVSAEKCAQQLITIETKGN